ncbi:hypothetical protein L195_g058444 [Trifolium pratense]|uniref:Chromo domain-containing protein n=1 Tax=Trifolium pratense TaxID=57577 RepID=A0A2K3JSA8_TRIPR|nr:hypothetical protein L195_g058444 [Trifolium pratense]
MGEVAYKLQLPAKSRIQSVFHASLLKKAIGDYSVQGELSQELEIGPDDDNYPEKVIGARTITRGGVSVSQSLVKWKNKPNDDVTWEDDVFLKGQFPDFSLEDKTFIEEEGIVRDAEVGLDVNDNKPKVWRFYRRKRGKE